MAFDIGSVTAKIDADITGFKKGIKEAEDGVGRLGSTIHKVGDGIANFGKQAAIFTGLAGAAVVAFGKSSVDSFNASQQEIAQLNAVLKSTGQIAGVTAEQAIELASSLQKTTKFSDEATLSAENLLLTFTNITSDIFPDATKTVLDMSTALGQDTKSSAIQLGKALQDPILGVTALRRVGVNFNEAQQKVIENLVNSGKAAEAQKMILKELQTEFGGSAEAAGKTFGGQLEILKNRFDDFKESVGGAIVAVIQFAGTGDDSALFDAINALIPDDETAARITEFFVTFRDVLMKVGEWISNNKELVITFLTGLAVALGALLVIGTITALVTALLNPLTLVALAIGALYTAWQTNFLGIRDTTQKVIEELSNFFNTYLKPAIEALVSFFRERWSYIQLIVEGAWKIIKGIIEVAWSLIYGLLKVGLSILSGDWSKAWEAIKQMVFGAWEGIKNIFNGALDFIKGWGGMLVHNLVAPFEEAWNKIKEFVNKIKDNLDFTKRHSPSVVDIVNKGVHEVNKALGGLAYSFNMTPDMAAASVSSNTTGPNITNVTVDLGGAIISDEFGAERMAELVGDTIVKKLQTNVRF